MLKLHQSPVGNGELTSSRAPASESSYADLTRVLVGPGLRRFSGQFAAGGQWTGTPYISQIVGDVQILLTPVAVDHNDGANSSLGTKHLNGFLAGYYIGVYGDNATELSGQIFTIDPIVARNLTRGIARAAEKGVDALKLHLADIRYRKHPDYSFSSHMPLRDRTSSHRRALE